MARVVTLIQGGGIGFDQAKAVQSILAAAGADLEWDEHLAGLAALQVGKPALSDDLFASVRQHKIALKTKLLVASDGPQINYNVEFRRHLGVFASVRPLKNIAGLPAKFDGVDICVIRELTEDLYAAIEHEIVPGVVQSIKVVTEKACRRFFEFAFKFTTTAGRKTIHCVHKANILKKADGLFLEVFRDTAKKFPDIQTKEIIVDNCCMQMVSRPQQFDVMVMGNLYGDIVSDLGAGLVGGVSATAGINFGDDVQVFETFHGGSIDQIGMDRGNPVPLLLPAIDLLEAIGDQTSAQRIFVALESVLKKGKVLTHDLGGNAGTSEFARAVIGEL